MNTRLLCLALVGVCCLLAGCEAPVDPGKVRLKYEARVAPTDHVYVIRRQGPRGSLEQLGGDTVIGGPGPLQLEFLLANGVRDEIFLAVGELRNYTALDRSGGVATVLEPAAVAYVSAVTIFRTRDSAPEFAELPAPPTPDPAVNAGVYRHLRPVSRSGDGRGMPAPETYVPVMLATRLPAGEWHHAEVAVTFRLHGFTRNPAGEFHDTLTKKVTVVRAEAESRPATASRPK